MKDEIVDRLHQPEYTGENRCGACTAVNVGIAVVLAAIVGRRSRLAGAVVLGVSAGLISLRGYLVPGTPTLTKRYLPAEVLQLFGKELEEPERYGGLGAVDGAGPGATGGTTSNPPADGDGRPPTATRADDPSADATAAEGATDGGEEPADGADGTAPAPERYLLELGAVEPCDDVDDLCLTEGFETRWIEAIDAIDVEAVDAADAASAFGLDDLGDAVGAGDDADGAGDDADGAGDDAVGAGDDADGAGADGSIDASESGEDADAFGIERHGEARLLRRGDRIVGKWPSQAALVADVTAAGLLDERDPEWETYPPETKGQLLTGLRLFLETCPTSGGDVVLGEETVESCCRSHQVVAVTCEDTGERLFEHPVEGIEG